MADKRPCRVCRRWFEVDPRAGRRHQVCDSEDCQRKRNQRACRRWRKENPHKVVAQRLRKRLPADPAPVAEVAALQPMAHFDPQVVRHAVGAKVQVVLEELAKVIARDMRHGVPPKSKVQRQEEAKVMPRQPRHTTASSRSPP
jgi:hypothetical protein